MTANADTSFRPGGMIGMLDYRAAKPYRLLALPLRLASYPINLALILGSFLLTRGWADSLAAHNPALGGYHVIIHIVLAWLTLELSSLLVQMLWFGAVGSLFFLIDVMPGEGRTHDQAMAVVKGGDIARLFLKMEDAENWTYSDTEQFVKRLSLVPRLFYREAISARIEETMGLIRDAIAERDGKRLNRREVDEITAPVKAKIPWQEKVFCSPIFLRSAIAYTMLLACFVMSYGG